MVAPNNNLTCQQAKGFYYNYLTGDGNEDIPQDMIKHIDNCPHCEAEVDKLQAKLEKTEHHASDDDSILLNTLELQYHYIDLPVSCNAVKSFLPILAWSAMNIRVPTPITAHIDNCPQCAEDLETIRNLGLTHKQLCILGQVYADKPEHNPNLCNEVSKWIDNVSMMNFENIPAETLKHFCICPECRTALQSKRQELISNVEWNEDKSNIPCESIRTNDIFDYTVPYGIDPTADQYAKFRKYLTSHLTHCEECLAKMNDLHAEIFRILERKESNIVSIFKANKSIQGITKDTVVDENNDYSIAIEVLDREKDQIRLNTNAPDPCVNLQTQPKTVSPSRFKSLLKPMAAAAAILLFAFIFFNGSSVNALDMKQMYKALEKIKNVHVIRHHDEDSRLINEMWISQSLNLKIIKNPSDCVLWDINSKEIKSKTAGTDVINTSKLDDKMLNKIESTMHSPWNLLPFNRASDIPSDAVWQEVTDEKIVSTDSNIEIYDLIWTQKTAEGAMLYFKWRCFVEVNSHLPQKTEFWEKFNKTEEYKLAATVKINYPTFDQVSQTVEKLGF